MGIKKVYVDIGSKYIEIYFENNEKMVIKAEETEIIFEDEFADIVAEEIRKLLN